MNFHKQSNDKLYSRNIPGKSLKPNFDFRPTATKYETPTPKPSQVPLFNYKLGSTFNPGDRGETELYALNINKESELRNQFMALQRDTQAQYVPNVHSDLYINPMNYAELMTPYKETLTNKNPFYEKNTFNNCTRMDIKNM
jgi:hypothetical protein|tara:strand:- start:422 stop:844 length:423 start_codon:yes stop_codon:yes gene_type:complete